MDVKRYSPLNKDWNVYFNFSIDGEKLFSYYHGDLSIGKTLIRPIVVNDRPFRISQNFVQRLHISLLVNSWTSWRTHTQKGRK